MGILSSLIGGGLSLLGNKLDADRQKEAATHSIRWRVADANKAGVSPLFALGAPTMNFSSNISGGLGEIGSGIGEGLESMGQDITRARAAGMDQDERAASGTLFKLQVERGGLENELLRRKIQQMSAPGVPGIQPRPVIPGQAPVDPDAAPVGIVMPGGGIVETQGQSPANTVQQWFGDIPEEIYGTPSAIWSAMKTYKNNVINSDVARTDPYQVYRAPFSGYKARYLQLQKQKAYWYGRR